MNYTKMFSAIVKELNKSGDGAYTYDAEMASAIELWSKMYQGKAPWLDAKTKSTNLPATIAAEIARLITIELESDIYGSALLSDLYQKSVLPPLREFVEYGLAKGSLVVKPIVLGKEKKKLSTQFIQADRFFPIRFDGSKNITKCVFVDQQRRGNRIYTLLEIHSFDNGILIVENRAYCSNTDSALGTEVSLSEVKEWSKLAIEARFAGAKKLPFGLFRTPLANQIDSGSPRGVSLYSRAIEHMREADRRYSNICWEYEAKEAAVHIAESMLKYDKEQDRYDVPEGRERLYRALDVDLGAMGGKPFVDIYSPEIRSSTLYDGFNHQLRLIEFDCCLAYGTLSDPNNVDKTAEEIKFSKQRSYSFVCDAQKALQKALEDWAEGACFWARIHGLEKSGSYKMLFNWGDGILANPEAERAQDMQDLANGTLRPEEYRAKWRNEDIDTALANLPDTAQVLS